jgi:poly-beta-1,6-N-acetyl-D-glucosamine synthase
MKIDLITAQEDKVSPLAHLGNYVLMTAAYNEGAHIEKTIQSVLSQSVLPDRWVIVSDGSTDTTDEIVRSYLPKCDFMRFLRVSRPPGHSFRSKVMALQAGQKLLDDIRFEFVGNMDADITIAPSYFESLLARFRANPRLGLAGGFVYEKIHGEFKKLETNRTHAVAHAAQLMRRECYKTIGGYRVLQYGGEDWHAHVSANMAGWDAKAFPELPIYHLRHTGASTNLLRSSFRLGRLDYSFGSHPLFEVFKCLLRLRSEPLILGAIFRFSGFVWCYLHQEQRPVSSEFISFLRRTQKARLSSLVRRFGFLELEEPLEQY